MARHAAAEIPADAPTPDRRLIARAYAHWNTLRRGGELPRRGQYQPSALPFPASSLFFISLDADESRDVVMETGAALPEAIAVDPVGKRVADVLPFATGLGLSLHRTAAQHRRPVADCGLLLNRAGKNIVYRSVLMPLDDENREVETVIGAFSFKIAT